MSIQNCVSPRLSLRLSSVLHPSFAPSFNQALIAPFAKTFTYSFYALSSQQIVCRQPCVHNYLFFFMSAIFSLVFLPSAV